MEDDMRTDVKYYDVVGIDPAVSSDDFTIVMHGRFYPGERRYQVVTTFYFRSDSLINTCRTIKAWIVRRNLLRAVINEHTDGPGQAVMDRLMDLLKDRVI
jgi:hypothetical protein